MKPAPFAYADPRELEEAAAMLHRYGEEAAILAGGQSLIPLMNLRLAQPAYVIDINRIPELQGIKSDGSRLSLGATVRHADVAASAEVRDAVQLLAEAAGLIGHPQIRHRGTAGGSLAEADPAGQLPATIMALGGEVVAMSVRGTRRILAADLFVGFLNTNLEPDELITEIVFPRPPDRSGGAFMEVCRRKGDFAMAGVAAQVSLSEDGAVSEAAIALAAMGPVPVRATRAEQALLGISPTDQTFREVAGLAGQAGDPVSDVHATAAYRRRAASVLAERAVRLAVNRARGEAA
jgi:CO/xanthine dehydrogenase FAD-binding subunit